MNEIAMWLGYGVMALGGLFVVLLAIGLCSALINEKIRSLYKSLQFHHDLKVLQDALRQLRADGKVRGNEVDRG